MQKMEFGQKNFHEIDLFVFTSFFGLDFFKFSGPLCTTGSKITPINYFDFSLFSEICDDITVVPSKYFFPVPWQEASMLFEKKSPAFWDEFFQNSYAIHYYDSSVNGMKMNRIQQPRFFGKEMPALTYLSLSHCPIALHSQ